MPLPVLVVTVPPPRYVRDWCVEVLEVMVPLLLPVLVPVLTVPDNSVVEDTSDAKVIVEDRDRYDKLPVGKSPKALPPVVTVPLKVSTDWADTAAAENSAVHTEGAIEIVRQENNLKIIDRKSSSRQDGERGVVETE